MEVITPWPHMPNLIQLVQGTEHGSVSDLHDYYNEDVRRLWVLQVLQVLQAIQVLQAMGLPERASVE